MVCTLQQTLDLIHSDLKPMVTITAAAQLNSGVQKALQHLRNVNTL